MALDALSFPGSILWPPTAFTGIMVWLVIVAASCAYMVVRKREKYNGNAFIGVQWADFAIRTLATAVSASVLVVQISGIEWSSPLGGAGTGQVYIAFGLIMSLVLLVSNLMHKLSSFVIPTWNPPQRSEEAEVKVEIDQLMFQAEILEKNVFHPGETVRFRATYKGNLVTGFFTAEVRSPGGLVLPDTRKPYVWWPAYSTLSRNKGILKGDKNHQITWDAKIPRGYPDGEYSVRIGVYDDLGTGRSCLNAKNDSFVIE